MINNFRLTENFNLREFQCQHCGVVMIDDRLVELLQKMRDRLGKPIIVTSGYRCPEHDKEVGGTGDSFHTRGLAADIYCPGFPLDALRDLADAIGFNGIGINYKNLHVHVDLGPRRKWIE